MAQSVFFRIYAKSNKGRTFASNQTISVSDEEIAEANADNIEGDPETGALEIAMGRAFDKLEEPDWVQEDPDRTGDEKAVEFEFKGKLL